MANENQNPLFAYVEARIAAWQAVLASLKSALALDPSGQTIEGMDFSPIAQNGDFGQPIDLPDGAFLGKSVPTCIKLYLSAVRKKKTVKEIAVALREGGVESTSDNFETPIYTALNRLKAAGEVLRFKDGWGLSVWYPANLRGTAGEPGKRSKNKKSKKKSKKIVAVKAAAPAKNAPMTSSTAKAAKPGALAVELLNSKPGTDFSVTAVGSHVGMGAKGARLLLVGLVKRGKAEKSGPDMYRIAQPQ